MSIVSKVISAEQAFELAKKSGELIVVVNDEKNQFCFTTYHKIPDELKSDPNWVSITHTFPIYVYPREGVETGVVDSYEKYKLVFEKNSFLLEDVGHV